MGKMVDNFKPTKIKPADLEKGVRYLPESPVQTDILGQVLNPGDLVVYGASGEASGNLEVGKVIGIYTRITPPRGYQIQQGLQAREETFVTLVLLDYGYLSRRTTSANNMLKISEEQFQNSKEDLQLLLEA